MSQALSKSGRHVGTCEVKAESGSLEDRAPCWYEWGQTSEVKGQRLEWERSKVSQALPKSGRHVGTSEVKSESGSFRRQGAMLGHVRSKE